MSKYTNVKVNISEGQRKKLKSALENSIDQVSIHLDSQDLMRGEDVLAVTKRQLNNMTKAFQNRKGVKVRRVQLN